jgi:hypothetical protein
MTLLHWQPARNIPDDVAVSQTMIVCGVHGSRWLGCHRFFTEKDTLAEASGQPEPIPEVVLAQSRRSEKRLVKMEARSE